MHSCTCVSTGTYNPDTGSSMLYFCAFSAASQLSGLPFCHGGTCELILSLLIFLVDHSLNYCQLWKYFSVCAKWPTYVSSDHTANVASESTAYPKTIISAFLSTVFPTNNPAISTHRPSHNISDWDSRSASALWRVFILQ